MGFSLYLSLCLSPPLVCSHSLSLSPSLSLSQNKNKHFLKNLKKKKQYQEEEIPKILLEAAYQNALEIIKLNFFVLQMRKVKLRLREVTGLTSDTEGIRAQPSSPELLALTFAGLYLFFFLLLSLFLLMFSPFCSVYSCQQIVQKKSIFWTLKDQDLNCLLACALLLTPI